MQVNTLEQLGKLEVWQIEELDLPLDSKRRLKREVERVHAQQVSPRNLQPSTQTTEPETLETLNPCLVGLSLTPT